MRLFCTLSLLFTLGFSGTSLARQDCSIPKGDELGIEDIVRLASSCNKSFNNFIRYLPESFKNNSVFVSNSLSLVKDCVDPLNPRVIFFSDKLILAFPWAGTKDPRCRIVEAIGISPNKVGLNPTIIKFIENGSYKSRVVDTSGKQCVKCHTADFKPIWKSYPLWENSQHGWRVYGARDDNIFIKTDEFKYFKSFLYDIARQDKLKWFGERVKSSIIHISTIFPDDPEEYSREKTSHDLYVFNPGDPKRHAIKALDRGPRPNLRFGQVIGLFAGRRISQRIMQYYPKDVIYKFISKLNICNNRNFGFGSFYPDLFNPLLNKESAFLSRVNLDENDFRLALDELYYTQYEDGTYTPAMRAYLDLAIYTGLTIPVRYFYREPSSDGQIGTDEPFRDSRLCKKVQEAMRSSAL